MPIVKLTNTTKDETRGIFGANGFAVARPGESVVVDAEQADIDANAKWFKVEKADEEDAVQADTTELERVNPPKELPEADEYDAKSETELRDLIEDRDGKRPHHNTSREKLLATARG